MVPYPQLLQHLKRIISDLCKLYNLPQHPDVEMLDQPLPAEQVSNGGALDPVMQSCPTDSTQKMHVNSDDAAVVSLQPYSKHVHIS